MKKKVNLSQNKQLIARIISGDTPFKFGGIKYIIKQPPKDVLQSADQLYEKTLYDNRFGDWLSETDVQTTLEKQDLWRFCTEDRIEKLSDNLSQYKVELYQSWYTSQANVKRSKRLIMQTKIQLARASNYRTSLYHWTLEGYAEGVRIFYLVKQTLWNAGKYIYKNISFNKVPYPILDMAVNQQAVLTIGDMVIRDLVRSEPWSTIWNIGKPNPFNIPPLELSDAQSNLIVYSRMYDNIAKSSEVPTDDIIDDHDALDGWIILQNRNAEKARIDASVQKTLSPKQQKGNEIFIPAKNKEEAKKINLLNDESAKMIKQQRSNLIQAKGEVKESEFLDTRLGLQRSSNQQFKGRGK